MTDPDGPAWSNTTAWDMPSLLERFSLHDSDLTSVMLEPGGPVVVVLQLDLLANKAVRQGFDTLLVAFERTYLLSYRCGPWLQSTLDGATSRLFSEAERATLLESKEFDLSAYRGRSSEVEHPAFDHSLTCTTFQSVTCAELYLLHAATVRCRCFNQSGESFDLASIDEVT
jgi:hypothetical protein